MPERETDSMVSEAGSTPNPYGSFAVYVPDTSSWRTQQPSLFGGWIAFSETWPRSGMTQSGIAFLHPPWALHTQEIASGLLPTPRASMGKHGICWSRAKSGEHRHNLEDRLASDHLRDGGEVISGGLAHPTFVEWMMGFPVGWTDLKPSATPKSRKSSKSSPAP